MPKSKLESHTLFNNGHEHEYEYMNGYSHCKICGCASDRHECVICKERFLGMKVLIAIQGQPYLFCSVNCGKKFLEMQ